MCTWLALSCLGHQPLGSGALPNSQLLSRAGIQTDNTERVEEETNRQVSLESQLEATRGTGSDKRTGEKSQLFLAAAGLPCTVTQKLAQRIWDLDFIEMEEFLPSNRVVQALEVSGLAREGTVYQLPQSRKVTEITSWIRCFTLYVAVMSSRRPELVAPMVAHLHTVIKLEQSMGGLGWLQYDWRARKELCAAGSTTWGKQDPWQLLACLPHASTSLDPFDVIPQDLMSSQPPARGGAPVRGRTAGSSGLNQPGPPSRRGGLADSLTGHQRGAPLERSVFLPTVVLFAERPTMAGEGARRAIGETTKGDQNREYWTAKARQFDLARVLLVDNC